MADILFLPVQALSLTRLDSMLFRLYPHLATDGKYASPLLWHHYHNLLLGFHLHCFYEASQKLRYMKKFSYVA
jgi:hypothetical protein